MTDPTAHEGAIPTPDVDSLPASCLEPDDDVSGRPERCAAHPALFPELPPLTVDAEITPELDRSLSTLARAARAGDPRARNALYTAMEAKIHRFVRRYRASSWKAHRIWDNDDLAQEAFLIFTDLITSWSGEGSFPPYFFAHFPWRLRDAVRRFNGHSPYTGITWTPYDLLSDNTAATDAAVALLEALAAGLPATSRAILLWHVRDGERFSAIATRLGISRRTVHRYWEATLKDLRCSLRAASGPMAPDPWSTSPPGPVRETLP